MEFRIVTEEEKGSVERLWRYCFGSEEPYTTWHFTDYYKRENTLGGFEKAKLNCALQLIPYSLYLRGTKIDTSYIVGVFTFPEARRSGAVSKLLLAAFQEIRERNQFVTLLMPFRAEFYHPFAFAFCYEHIQYLIRLKDLRLLTNKSATGFSFSAKNEINWEMLQYVYNLFNTTRNGYVLRDQQVWDNLLTEHFGEQGYGCIIKEEGRPTGYILYLLKEDRIWVREMVYISEKAKRSLFSFLYAHSSQVEFVEWNAPSNDLSYLELPDPKTGIHIHPFLTARLIDVNKALASIKYPNVAASVTIRVFDSFDQSSNSCFHLTVNHGQGYVERCERVEVDIAGDISAITQLFMCYLSAKDLFRIGKITGTIDKIDVLDALFPRCNNYINEYF